LAGNVGGGARGEEEFGFSPNPRAPESLQPAFEKDRATPGKSACRCVSPLMTTLNRECQASPRCRTAGHEKNTGLARKTQSMRSTEAVTGLQHSGPSARRKWAGLGDSGARHRAGFLRFFYTFGPNKSMRLFSWGRAKLLRANKAISRAGPEGNKTAHFNWRFAWALFSTETWPLEYSGFLLFDPQKPRAAMLNLILAEVPEARTRLLPALAAATASPPAAFVKKKKSNWRRNTTFFVQ